MTTTGQISNSLAQSLNGSADKTKKKGDQVGKNEFLMMLVTQLKNQDPMNPMDGDQFAVNLAQFSQLEQLIDINGKIGKQEDTAASSLASYLGHEVTLDTDKVHVENGDGDLLKVNVSSNMASMSVDLLDADGKTVKSFDLGEVKSGKQTIKLEDLGVANGDYAYRVRGRTTSGSDVTLASSIAGIVSGFVPGPDPTLLVGGREVSLSEIKEVHAAD